VIFGLAHGALWAPGIVAGLALASRGAPRDPGEAVAAHATANGFDRRQRAGGGPNGSYGKQLESLYNILFSGMIFTLEFRLSSCLLRAGADMNFFRTHQSARGSHRVSKKISFSSRLRVHGRHGVRLQRRLQRQVLHHRLVSRFCSPEQPAPLKRLKSTRIRHGRPHDARRRLAVLRGRRRKISQE